MPSYVMFIYLKSSQARERILERCFLENETLKEKILLRLFDLFLIVELPVCRVLSRLFPLEFSQLRWTEISNSFPSKRKNFILPFGLTSGREIISALPSVMRDTVTESELSFCICGIAVSIHRSSGKILLDRVLRINLQKGGWRTALFNSLHLIILGTFWFMFNTFHVKGNLSALLAL